MCIRDSRKSAKSEKLSSKAAITSLPPAQTAEKSFLIAKNRRCLFRLRLFCEIAKMTERLVFDGDKYENNALQSYFISFTLSSNVQNS